MNMHMSEIMSFILEPVANTMEDTAEIISCEHMKSKLDKLNDINKEWRREEPLEGTLLNNLAEEV
jgi:hypothetical protein